MTFAKIYDKMKKYKQKQNVAYRVRGWLLIGPNAQRQKLLNFLTSEHKLLIYILAYI